jgi:hypothetical protein
MKYDYTDSNGISNFIVDEGNLRAEKCVGDFGGPNMWRLHVKTQRGYWESVQWMDVHKIQMFLKTELPVYNEQESKQKYSLK